MAELVDYRLDDDIATITMDDGKANVMSLPMMAGLADAFRQAESDAAVAVLTGRDGLFSAGYDMAMFNEPMETIAATLLAGGELVAQILAHPFPVVAACGGHSIAQGAFVLLACDVRLGVDAPVKVGLNEVAIGLTIPHYGVEVARHQLVPAWFDHATVTGTLYDAAGAQRAGFFHELVAPDRLADAARAGAERLAAVDMAAHAGTKLRTRRPVLDAIAAMHGPEFELP
ncbi:MAG: crotonase/enoyl-CoA hydratase family protein [Acidimicrobiales bacterium]|nr:crotonase/enoyl-CoA hydratase family protein [Acidimicrobiales bacterium]